MLPHETLSLISGCLSKYEHDNVPSSGSHRGTNSDSQTEQCFATVGFVGTKTVEVFKGGIDMRVIDLRTEE